MGKHNSDADLGYGILRLTLGLDYLFHLANRWPHVGQFVKKVVTYTDLAPGGAITGSSLLVKQVQAEGRNVDSPPDQEDGRPNHFMVVEPWRISRDLNALRNSDSNRPFRAVSYSPCLPVHLMDEPDIGLHVDVREDRWMAK